MRAFASAIAAIAAVAAVAIAPAAPAAEETQFGGWTLRCETEGPAEKRSCLITTDANAPKSDRSVLAVAIGAPAGSTDLRIAFKAVPQVKRETGLLFRIDGGPAHKAPFGGCTKDACILQFPLADDLRKTLLGGKLMLVAFELVDGGGHVAGHVLVPVPLDGLSEGVTALLERNRG